MADDPNIPPAHSFAWTTVQALRALGGSGTIEEINEECVKIRGLTEEQQAVPHPRGSRSEAEYRLTWARTLTKALGLITNSERGVWALTEFGRTADEHAVEELKRKRSRERASAPLGSFPIGGLKMSRLSRNTRAERARRRPPEWRARTAAR